MNSKRPVMLSFDDGPLPGATDRVLEILAGYHGEDGAPLRAGFFMVGDAPANFWPARRYYAPYELWIHKGSMRRYPALVREVMARGHEIGNHTLNHMWGRWPRYRRIEAVQNELLGWEVAAQSAGWSLHAPRWFRSPYLIDTPVMRLAVAQAGYQWVGGHTVGDAVPRSDQRRLLQTVDRVLNLPGEAPLMLILHDILPVTVANLGAVLDEVQRRGHPLWHFAPVLLPRN